MYGCEQTHGGINKALTSNAEVLSIQYPKHVEFAAKWQHRAVPMQWPALLTGHSSALCRHQITAPQSQHSISPHLSYNDFPLCFAGAIQNMMLGGCSSHCFGVIRSLDQFAMWLSHCSPPPAPQQRCATDSLVNELHKFVPKISGSSIQDYAKQQKLLFLQGLRQIKQNKKTIPNQIKTKPTAMKKNQTATKSNQPQTKTTRTPQNKTQANLISVILHAIMLFLLHPTEEK